ncbi:uncharacterized protein VTP21DRAFT_5815 [Calcarisporiella thermophila]|uniref:uncharacterized protein n=1 Tax=Calcarisporiella thermophila TaxID=911321 RepID=UPI0037420618
MRMSTTRSSTTRHQFAHEDATNTLRRLRIRLAFAKYKSQNGLERYGLDDLERMHPMSGSVPKTPRQLSAIRKGNQWQPRIPSKLSTPIQQLPHREKQAIPSDEDAARLMLLLRHSPSPHVSYQQGSMTSDPFKTPGQTDHGKRETIAYRTQQQRTKSQQQSTPLTSPLQQRISYPPHMGQLRRNDSSQYLLSPPRLDEAYTLSSFSKLYTPPPSASRPTSSVPAAAQGSPTKNGNTNIRELAISSPPTPPTKHPALMTMDSGIGGEEEGRRPMAIGNLLA